MKRFKFLSFLLIAISAVAFTSCLDDDDDDNKGLSPQQIMNCYNATRGDHSGSIIYAKWDYDKNANSKPDTLNASWSITTDSTMIIRNVPSSVIASVVSDSTLRDAIADQSPVNIRCYIGYINDSPVQWLINPVAVTYSNLSYNGGTHKVAIAFGINTSWSFGQLSSNNITSKQQMQIIAATLYVDDKVVSDGINFNSYASRQSMDNRNRLRALMLVEK